MRDNRKTKAVKTRRKAGIKAAYNRAPKGPSMPPTKGGTYGFCDTDSMAIVTADEGLATPSIVATDIPRLSVKAIEGIVERFSSLNPYAADAVPGSILEIKEVSRGNDGQPTSVLLFVISSKRYTFFRHDAPGEIVIIEPSEHGLGHLLSPYGDAANDVSSGETDDGPVASWISEVWEWVVRRELALPERPLCFGHLPAITRTSVSTPHMLRGLARQTSGPLAIDRLRPATFLLSATIARFGYPAGVNPAQFHLVSPYSRNPSDWLRGPWVDVYSGKEYAVTTDRSCPDPEVVKLKTFRDVVEEFPVHPERKSAGTDGRVCGPLTRGLLQRRHVRAARIDVVGKESNRLEEVRKGLVHDWGEVVTPFHDPEYDQWENQIRPKLSKLTTAEIAKITGLGERAARNISGGSRPGIRAIAKLCKVLA